MISSQTLLLVVTAVISVSTLAVVAVVLDTPANLMTLTICFRI